MRDTCSFSGEALTVREGFILARFVRPTKKLARPLATSWRREPTCRLKSVILG